MTRRTVLGLQRDRVAGRVRKRISYGTPRCFRPAASPPRPWSSRDGVVLPGGLGPLCAGRVRPGPANRTYAITDRLSWAGTAPEVPANGPRPTRVPSAGVLEGDERVGGQVLGGDEFGGWVEPHLLAMTQLAVRLVPDGDADDVVQEALTRAWRRQSTYVQARGTPRAWLLAIVADQARRHRTRHRPLPRSGPAGVGQSAVGIEDRADIDQAIRALPRRQRLAVELYYFVGLPVRECAQAMNCTEGTVKSTLYDARARLAPLLEVTT